MAVAVLKSSLAPSQKVDLEKILTITEILDYIPGMRVQPIPSSALCCLDVGDYYHIPYIIARRFLQTPHRTDYPIVDLQFRGTLRPQQITVGQEAIAQLEKDGTTILALCTGFGKTVVASALACHLRLLTLVFYHLTTINAQQEATFRRDTNAVIWVVGEGDPPPGFTVILCMRERLHRIPKEVLRLVGTFIIDEAHLHCTFHNINNLLQVTPRYIILQSATLEKKNGLHNIMYAITGRHRVERQSTVPFNVVQVSIPSIYPADVNAKGKPCLHSLRRHTANDMERNYRAAELAIRAVQEGKKPLILTHLVEHVYIMERLLQEMQQEVSVMCESRKNYKDANILVGSVSKIGTAFDAATLCSDYRGKPFDVLIVMTSFASETILVQCVGRVLRADSATIYHLVNNRVRIYAKHWKFCLQWYETRATSVDYM